MSREFRVVEAGRGGRLTHDGGMELRLEVVAAPQVRRDVRLHGLRGTPVIQGPSIEEDGRCWRQGAGECSEMRGLVFPRVGSGASEIMDIRNAKDPATSEKGDSNPPHLVFP